MSLRVALATRSRGPRLAYVIDVLCERYGWSWAYAAEAGGSSLGGGEPGGVRLVYGTGADGTSTAYGKRELRIVPATGWLDAPGGSTGDAPDWGEFGGTPCPTGADPLAGAFFCLALLGEHGDRGVDRHGRLPAGTHPLYLRGLARVPIADRLLEAVARGLWSAAGQTGAPAVLPEASAATSDVDAPSALAHRPTVKRATALVRGAAAALRHPRPDLGAALGSLPDYLRGSDDPFDTFDYMHRAAARRGLREDVFTLVGYGTRLDPGWPRGHDAWGKFWRKLDPDVRLGIHPSYRSSERPELIAEEVAVLREATDREIVTSRQHFLRLRIPDTFRALISCGIREDHSLMWADAEGFRAGTARSFRWYDVQREEVTPLRLFPPHAMDVTARYYGGLSPKQAIATWTALAAEAHASGTGLRCIWHNSNLGPWYGWLPWREAFEASLDLSVIREGT